MRVISILWYYDIVTFECYSARMLQLSSLTHFGPTFIELDPFCRTWLFCWNFIDRTWPICYSQLTILTYLRFTFVELDPFGTDICRTSWILDLHVSNRGQGAGKERRAGRGVYLHMLSYIIIYLHIPLYPHTLASTSIYLHYSNICVQISNIRNMRSNMRSKNVHISSPRPFPKVRICQNAS